MTCLREARRVLLSSALAVPLTALVVAGPASAEVVVDSANTDVTTENVFLDWSPSVPTNPEEVGILRWSRIPSTGGPAGPNLTATSDLVTLDPCDGLLEHFGNSWAPPDPQVGGTVLVGEGSTGTWAAGPGFKKVTIHSAATGCPNSAGAPVVTDYQFWENAPFKSTAGPWQRIRVRREFTLTGFAPNTCGTGISCFRPYIPRLRMKPVPPASGFDQVLYPTTSGTLASVVIGFVVPFCPTGCSDTPAPGAASLPGDPWDATRGWFAINNPATGEGLIVKRLSSTPADLWVDFDCDATCSPGSTNATSILLLVPTGFTGTLLEEEDLCFYDAVTWPAARRMALELPPGC